MHNTIWIYRMCLQISYKQVYTMKLNTFILMNVFVGIFANSLQGFITQELFMVQK